MAITNSGFSKFDRLQRIDYIVENSALSSEETSSFFDYDAKSAEEQSFLCEMIENYIGNIPMPIGIVPHMVVNEDSCMVPFVTEESSVIAAASKAAKFWSTRGGFKAEVTSMTKKGQVHFNWNGEPVVIENALPGIRQKLMVATASFTEKMRRRGGGITEIQILDKTSELPDYYQLDVSFETADAMGANFINSCLEAMAVVLQQLPELNSGDQKVEVIMSILSNYTPDCLVKCHVECLIEELSAWNMELSGFDFATKFKRAVDIANLDVSRAVTHNKGIMNGIDAVLLATGNDTRATAAAAHSYASGNGSYQGLTRLHLTDQTFRYEVSIPLAVGTVGGITKVHPSVQKTFAILNFPDARKLMMIAVASGLASNFSAIASLITTGIQRGHMRMHLSNILNQLQVSQLEREGVVSHFTEKIVSYGEVTDYISKLRKER